MAKSSLYEPSVYQACIQRLEDIDENTPAQWGKMNASQMLAHCADVQEVINGTKALQGTNFIIKLFAPFIKRLVVSEKAFRKNGATHPMYVQKGTKDFQEEKARLLKSIQTFVETPPEEAEKIVHPFFGKLSLEEKGWSSYKHLNHHLEQFGV